MATHVPEPISPELVLVCPDLAAAARAALPEVDPDATLRRPSMAADARPPAWVSALVYAAATLAGLTLRAALWVVVVALVLTVPLLL